MRVFITGTVVRRTRLGFVIDGGLRTIYVVSVLSDHWSGAEEPRPIFVNRTQFDAVCDGVEVASWPVEISPATTYQGREYFVFELDPSYDVRATPTPSAVVDS